MTGERRHWYSAADRQSRGRGRRPMSSDDLSLDEARRIALAAQGFDRPRSGGRVDARHLDRAIRRLGLLQIDSVNVLVRSHYQVPFARLGPYDRTLLDEVVYRRGAFTEQWAHEASIVPVEHWHLLRHRREAHRVARTGSRHSWSSGRSTPPGCSMKCGVAAPWPPRTCRSERGSTAGSRATIGPGRCRGRCSRRTSAGACWRWPAVGPTSPARSTWPSA